MIAVVFWLVLYSKLTWHAMTYNNNAQHMYVHMCMPVHVRSCVLFAVSWINSQCANIYVLAFASTGPTFNKSLNVYWCVCEFNICVAPCYIMYHVPGVSTESLCVELAHITHDWPPDLRGQAGGHYLLSTRGRAL